jgi:hypothetical protein
MIKKRINTDLTFNIKLLNNSGTNVDLTKVSDITVTTINIATKGEMSQKPTLDNNVINFQYSSLKNKELGFFNIKVSWTVKSNNSETGYFQYYCDFPYAFQIVPISENENTENKISTGEMYSLCGTEQSFNKIEKT